MKLLKKDKSPSNFSNMSMMKMDEVESMMDPKVFHPPSFCEMSSHLQECASMGSHHGSEY